MRAEWESNTRGLRCPWSTKASQRATTLVDRLRDGWQHLLRDRATRSLTYNDEQFHVLERIKVCIFYLLIENTDISCRKVGGSLYSSILTPYVSTKNIKGVYQNIT